MLENLLRPFLLARVALTLGAAFAVTLACVAAARHMAVEGLPQGSTARIRGERALELGAVALGLALVAEVLAALVAVLGAAESHDEIRGAMCAYGVLTSTPHGVASLGTATVTALGCAAALGLVSLDARLDDLRLARVRAMASFALAPALFLDAHTAASFVSELDFGVLATCCSSGAEAASTSGEAASTGAPMLAIALGLGAIAMLPRRGVGVRGAIGVASALGAVAFLPTAVMASAEVTAPHVFGVTNHRCAFCLLEPAGHHIGYVAFGAAFVAACAGAAFLAVRAVADLAPEEAREVEERATRLSRGAVIIALLALVGPVLAFRIETGTFVVPPLTGG